MEYHRLPIRDTYEAVKQAVGRFILPKVDISPNEVNVPDRPLEERLAMDIDDLRWEAQAEAYDETND